MGLISGARTNSVGSLLSLLQARATVPYEPAGQTAPPCPGGRKSTLSRCSDMKRTLRERDGNEGITQATAPQKRQAITSTRSLSPKAL